MIPKSISKVKGKIKKIFFLSHFFTFISTDMGPGGFLYPKSPVKIKKMEIVADVWYPICGKPMFAKQATLKAQTLNPP
jgi:hypothetical protein